jgi:hypothetical protein
MRSPLVPDESYMKNLSPIEIIVLELLVSGGEM